MILDKLFSYAWMQNNTDVLHPFRHVNRMLDKHALLCSSCWTYSTLAIPYHGEVFHMYAAGRSSGPVKGSIERPCEHYFHMPSFWQPYDRPYQQTAPHCQFGAKDIDDLTSWV